MKRTSFLLAALTAIVLLACSPDNLNPLTEDLNSSQVPTKALQKVSIGDEVQGIDPGQSTTNGIVGSKCVSCGSMTFTWRTGDDGWSDIATCDFTTGSPSIPSNAKNISYHFTGNGPINNSTPNASYSLDYAYAECGKYTRYLYSYPTNIYTTLFEDYPANVVCRLVFHGNCYGQYIGDGTCVVTISNVRGCQEYSY